MKRLYVPIDVVCTLHVYIYSTCNTGSYTFLSAKFNASSGKMIHSRKRNCIKKKNKNETKAKK